jgi:hypothetical protein
MNEREIASIVSNVTPKVGKKRQRHYRYVNGTEEILAVTSHIL